MGKKYDFTSSTALFIDRNLVWYLNFIKVMYETMEIITILISNSIDDILFQSDVKMRETIV